MKKTLHKMSQYFPKPYNHFGRNVKVELDFPNYPTKSDLKEATLAAKSDLVNLKAEIDKTDVDKLKTVSVDLSKLSNLVNNDVVKKTVYDQLVEKANTVDTSGFVLKTKYYTNKSSLEYLILMDLLKNRL